MMRNDEILTPLDSANLIRRRLLEVPGKSFESQRIHKTLLDFADHKEECGIAFDVAALYNTDDGYIDIPVSFVSYRTLAYMGLSESKVDDLWMQWIYLRRANKLGDGDLVKRFKKLIIDSFERGVHDTTDQDPDEWRACLESCGIDTNIRGIIMDPHYKQVCLSWPCLFLVTNIIKLRWAGLEDIQKASQERDKKLPRRENGSQALAN